MTANNADLPLTPKCLKPLMGAPEAPVILRTGLARGGGVLYDFFASVARRNAIAHASVSLRDQR